MTETDLCRLTCNIDKWFEFHWATDWLSIYWSLVFGSLSFRLVPLWQEEGDRSFVTETLGIGEGELDAHGADGGGIWGRVLGREQLKQVPGPVSRKQQEEIQIWPSVRLSLSLPSINISIYLISSPACKLYAVCPSVSWWGLVLPYFGRHGPSCLLRKVHVDGAATVVLQKGDLCPLVRGGGSKRNALVGSLGDSNKLIKSLGGQRSC